MCETKPTSDPAQFFRLKKPCSNCPFLKEGAIKLREGRRDEILSKLEKNDNAPFYCHKTLNGHESEESGYQLGGGEMLCAGAAAVLWKRGRPSVGMRLALVYGYASQESWEDNSKIVIE